MKQRTLIVILALISVVVLGNTVMQVNSYQQSKRTVVIDVIRVFNEFKLKKDLEDRVAVKLNEYKSSIDSLNAVYQSLARQNAGNDVLVNVAVEIDTMQTRAQRAYQISDRNINEQVWQRLNTLLTEYGEKYDYSLVIGANGMGTVLYNKKGLDKTEELIKFINEKYERGN